MSTSMSNNRFSRAAQTGQAKSEQSVASSGATSGNLHETHDYDDLQELRDRLNKVQERKMKTELQLEQTTRQIEECRKMAKDLFGVESLEELQAFVARAQEEDQKIMADFRQKLAEEESKLNDIDQKLKDLDRENA